MEWTDFSPDFQPQLRKGKVLLDAYLNRPLEKASKVPTLFGFCFIIVEIVNSFAPILPNSLRILSIQLPEIIISL